MTVLDLRPQLAVRRRKRFLRHYGMIPSAAVSSIYAANVRLALLPMMLACVWADELHRYARAMTLPAPQR